MFSRFRSRVIGRGLGDGQSASAPANNTSNVFLPQRKVLPATRNGLRSAGDAMNPSKVGGKLGRCEQIKDLAAMRRYEGWQRDCTMMLDFL